MHLSITGIPKYTTAVTAVTAVKAETEVGRLMTL